MQKINRRNFLQKSLLTTAAVGFSAQSWRSVRGANEDVRAAVIGFNGRGKDHMSGIAELRESGKNIRIVALCDADRNVLDAGVKRLSTDSQKVEGYLDIRKLLENKGIDVVTVATPNHWHSLATIWACQAGKDVYCEKPVSHNVWEGRKMVEAARKYNRIVQTGTQSRSSNGIKQAIAYVKEGHIGKIVLARGLCYKRRDSIGKVDAPTPIPDGIDYDLWCGPAPMVPLMRKRLHYDWHWVWATGCGDLGNQGIHQMDIARWFLGVDELSPRVFSIGGRFGYVDDGETPNTQIVYHDYAAAPLIFEVRGLPDKTGSRTMDRFRGMNGASVAVVIDCEGGSVLVPDYTSAIITDKEGKEIKRFKETTSHYGNFLQAVLSRKSSDLNADVLEGHLSSALCHTGNVSYRLGHTMAQGEVIEKIKGDRDAVATFERMKEHLAANGVNIDSAKPALGTFLKMDPKTEKFLGNNDANKMLTREYRKPYVVPVNV